MTMTLERPPATDSTDGPFRVEVHLPGESWGSNALRFWRLDEAYRYGSELLGRWFVPDDFRVMHADYDEPWAVYSCPSCGPYVAGELAPSHRGSEGCESGSLASGGSQSHCACSACFG